MAMVAEFVLEKTFEKLYIVVEDFICKNLMFRSISTKIKSQLCCLEPLIQQMAQYNQQLGLPKAELEAFEQLMRDGIVLVHKCAEIDKLSLLKKYKYTNKLEHLNASLEEQYKMLNVLMARDVRKNTVMLLDIGEAVSRLDCGIQNRSAEINAWCAVPELPSLTVGLDIPVKELKMKLLVEDNGVSMLVVTALGGCGKTTLATKFCQDPEVKEKFKENILFVTVARNPNLDLIVQNLYRQKGYDVPTHLRNEVDTTRWLQFFLKKVGQNPFLLVLDDVWSGSEALLSKFDQVKISSYKVLVTSRSEFSEIGSSYHLPLLDEAAAMELFNHSASLTDKSSHIPEHLSIEVIKRCKGSPLAITVSGRSLCGKRLEIWQKRVIEWSKGFSIFDSETELLFCLQSSLDTLDRNMSTAKECFLDLGSFPEDKNISVSTLIDMWAELYELDEDALCIGYLYELCNRSLVNVVDKREDKMNGDGYYLEHFVTQHDLLRELAIYNSRLVPVEHRERLIADICGDNLPKWWREQNYKPMKARLLSVSTDEKFSMKWPDMQLPNAEVLVLNFQTKKYVLPEFVDKMDNLKVLAVTNDRFVILHAQLSNFERLGSLSKLKRMRLEGILVPSITTKSLQKISLFSCDISQAFSDISAFPNLEELNIDRYLEEFPVEVFFLTHLKKLSITNCSRVGALPELGSLVNLEELRMRSCANLSGIPNSIDRLNKLRKFDMSHCPSLNYLPESVEHLQQLEEVICDEGIKHLWKSFLPSLKSIQTMVSKVTQVDNSYKNWYLLYHGCDLRSPQ